MRFSILATLFLIIFSVSGKAQEAANPVSAPLSQKGPIPPSQSPPAKIRQKNGSQGQVTHSEAYKKRNDLGPYLNFKVTPPEGRGAKGKVLVEVYNYSKTYLNVVDFWLYLSNPWGDTIEVHITCEDIKPNWSALRWVTIPGGKDAPKVEKVQVKNLAIFNDEGKKVELKYTIDLIKK